MPNVAEEVAQEAGRREHFFKTDKGTWDFARGFAALGFLAFILGVGMSVDDGMSPGPGWLMISGIIAVAFASQIGLLGEYGGGPRIWHLAFLAVVCFAIAVASDLDAGAISLLAGVAAISTLIGYNEVKADRKNRSKAIAALEEG